MRYPSTYSWGGPSLPDSDLDFRSEETRSQEDMPEFTNALQRTTTVASSSFSRESSHSSQLGAAIPEMRPGAVNFGRTVERTGPSALPTDTFSLDNAGFGLCNGVMPDTHDHRFRGCFRMLWSI